MNNKLFKSIDNAPLILFRIFFGLVFVFESFGAILTGWVNENLVAPKTNFTFIGFEFLLPLMGNYMYVHFVLMGILSIAVTIGYKYRLNMVLLTLFWATVYFMQKTSYNNHYYLMLLFCVIMCFLPANKYASVDVKKDPKLVRNYMPQWFSLIFIIQITCVYFYATVAKFYPDWLDGTVTRNMFYYMDAPDFIMPLFQNHTFHIFIAYAGIAFGGLIIPALLFKKTRKWAIIFAIIFHIFNSITLQIGVFPYFALAFSVFFFPADQIRKFFFRKKLPLGTDIPALDFESKKLLYFFFIPFLTLQVLLPIRHWFIQDDVLWTEEGHRLSWRMMLRSRSGVAEFKVVDKKDEAVLDFDMNSLLTNKQIKGLNAPDFIWQAAQKIKTIYAEQGIDVAVYARTSEVSVNGNTTSTLIDPQVDLTLEKWNAFTHHDWILERTFE